MSTDSTSSKPCSTNHDKTSVEMTPRQPSSSTTIPHPPTRLSNGQPGFTGGNIHQKKRETGLVQGKLEDPPRSEICSICSGTGVLTRKAAEARKLAVTEHDDPGFMQNPTTSTAGTRDPICGLTSRFSTVLGGQPAALEHISRHEVDNSEHEDSNSKRQELENLKSLVQSLQDDNHRLKERMDNFERVLKGIPKSDEVFVSKADSLSISDLTCMIQILNHEIYQASASLGDSLVYCARSLPGEDTWEKYVAYSKSILGPSLTELLRRAAGKSKNPESVHALLATVTVQATLVNFCTKKINLWGPKESPIGQFLHTLYREIRSSSGQAISGHWRSLTRAHLKPEIQTWSPELTTELHGVLMAASWEVKSQADVESFEAKVGAIFKTVQIIRTAIGEKVTSSDVEVCIVQPGLAFSRILMEDEYPDDRREGQPATVIATVGMGLFNVVPSRHNDSLAYMNVLPPKVVLKSTLAAALKPVPLAWRWPMQDGRAD